MTSDMKMTGLGLVGLAATALAAPAFAQTAPPAPNTGNISVALGADIVTSYIFRGFEQENQGLIIQPYVEVGAPLGDTGVDLTVGTWSSIHSEGTGHDGGGGPSRWYEADLYASLGYELTDKIGVSVGYTGYFYPNGAFDSIDELNFGIAYDDSELMGDWSISPYAMVAVEVRDGGGEEGTYLELGGELGAPFIQSEDLPVEFSFPLAIGFSLDNYYESDGGNELFGFLLVGAAATMPLDQYIPSSYGTWAVSAGVDLIYVNDDAGLLSDGDDFEFVGKIGIGMEY